MNEDYLCHHGVKGMKWGRRKQRTTSVKSRRSNKTNKIKKTIQKKLTNVDKDKVKTIAKTSAVIAGRAAVAVALGSGIGLLGYSVAAGMKSHHDSVVDYLLYRYKSATLKS